MATVQTTLLAAERALCTVLRTVGAVKRALTGSDLRVNLASLLDYGKEEVFALLLDWFRRHL